MILLRRDKRLTHHHPLRAHTHDHVMDSMTRGQRSRDDALAGKTIQVFLAHFWLGQAGSSERTIKDGSATQGKKIEAAHSTPGGKEGWRAGRRRIVRGDLHGRWL